MNKFAGFSSDDLKILSRLDTPLKIQDYIDRLEYNLELRGETCMSPLRVMREKSANCIEAALFAAAALRFHGQKPLIADLTSVRDDDHVIAIFRQNGFIGAIAKSKYSGLSYREPIHRNMRELAISYFEEYFNFDREKTLRGFSSPVDLSIFDKRNWMSSEKNTFFIEGYLNKISHTPLISANAARNLRDVTPLMKNAGELWMTKNGLLKKIRTSREK